MENKHYIKVFLADEGYFSDFDGAYSAAEESKEKLCIDIGTDIESEISKDLNKRDELVYGYRIDYKIYPIIKDPFK